MFSHRQYLLISIIFILTFSAVSFLYSPVAAQGSAEVYKEDYSGDGNVNIADVIALLLYQRANPGDLVGDYNGDGSASITDAISLLLAIVNGTLSPLDVSSKIVQVDIQAATGGTIEHPNGTVAIIPANALNENSTITIEDISAENLMKNGISFLNDFELVDIGPSGIQLNDSIEILLPIPDYVENLETINPFFFDVEDSTWTQLPNMGIDNQNGTIKTKTNHFTLFAPDRTLYDISLQKFNGKIAVKISQFTTWDKIYLKAWFQNILKSEGYGSITSLEDFVKSSPIGFESHFEVKVMRKRNLFNPLEFNDKEIGKIKLRYVITDVDMSNPSIQKYQVKAYLNEIEVAILNDKMQSVSFDEVYEIFSGLPMLFLFDSQFEEDKNYYFQVWTQISRSGFSIGPYKLSNIWEAENGGSIESVSNSDSYNEFGINYKYLEENSPPISVLIADIARGVAPLTVKFSPAGSSDPDGTIVFYSLDVDSDGVIEIEGESASHIWQTITYSEPGDYTATLTVTDDDGASASSSINIEVLEEVRYSISGRIKAVSSSDDGPITPGELPSIEMVSIPAGSFYMGSDPESLLTIPFDPLNYEKPKHRVTLDAFEMSAFEITRSQYVAVMGSEAPLYSYETGTENWPANNISWIDAATFCNELSELTGLEPCYDLNSLECDFSKNGYRLPTEAEWEYACRAGNFHIFLYW